MRFVPRVTFVGMAVRQNNCSTACLSLRTRGFDAFVQSSNPFARWQSGGPKFRYTFGTKFIESEKLVEFCRLVSSFGFHRGGATVISQAQLRDTFEFVLSGSAVN